MIHLKLGVINPFPPQTVLALCFLFFYLRLQEGMHTLYRNTVYRNCIVKLEKSQPLNVQRLKCRKNVNSTYATSKNALCRLR